MFSQCNYRVLIYCTCHFQSSSLFFIYFGFLCLQVSSVSNFCPDTRGKGGHLFRLTCSVVLWGGRNIANKNITGVCGECLQCMDHTEFAPAHWHFPGVLSRSTLVRLQVALQGKCPKQALGCMQFPGLSHSGSGSRVFHKCTDSVGLVFCAVSRSKKLK